MGVANDHHALHVNFDSPPDCTLNPPPLPVHCHTYCTGDSWGIAEVTQLLGHPETRLGTKAGGITWAGQRVNASGHLEGSRTTQHVEPVLQASVCWMLDSG
jgi:hypothetical protein